MKNNIYELRIQSIDLSVYHIATIFMTDDSVYSANLSHDFSTLFCYPKNKEEWTLGTVNESASAIAWPDGFEVHFDQIIGLSKVKKELT